VQLHRAREDFEHAGVRLVLIGQATPRDAAEFRRRMAIELPILADQRRDSYRAFGLRRGGVPQLVGPKVVAKGVLTSVRSGVHQGRPVGNVAQLGGAAVILPGGRVAFEHRARDASDNVAPEQLLAAARTAA
jgi:prostamide/prostaglandin F2alpha synthase